MKQSFRDIHCDFETKVLKEVACFNIKSSEQKKTEYAI